MCCVLPDVSRVCVRPPEQTKLRRGSRPHTTSLISRVYRSFELEALGSCVRMAYCSTRPWSCHSLRDISVFGP